MQYQYLHEVLRLLLQQSDFNSNVFSAFFDNSDHLIAFNYCCSKKRFTNFSQSFEKILGYNPRKILLKEDFICRIVHPHDKAILIDFLFAKSSNLGSKEKYVRFNPVIHETKCRAGHLKGYWKYFNFFNLDYFDIATGYVSKIGLMANESFQSKFDTTTKNLDHVNWSDIAQGNTAFKYNAASVNISKREIEILQMISDGIITKEIAHNLHISTSTVITHRKNLISKFNARNTAQLVKKASQLMLI